MPKKFNFSLESILKYRKNLENNEAITLNNKKIILHSEELKLQNIKELKEKSLKESKNDFQGNLNLLDRKIQNEYINQMSQSITNQSRVVIQSQKNVENARQKLTEETKKKKILEKLKDKQLDGFRVNLRRQEEKDSSEAALRKNFYNNN